MATTAIHVQGGPVVANHPAAQQAQQQHQNRNLKQPITCLAITQIVVGAPCFIIAIVIGILVDDYSWFSKTAGAWAGGWTLQTGIIGIRSTHVGHTNLNYVYLAFSIISTCASAASIVLFTLAVIAFRACYISAYFLITHIPICVNRNVGLGLFGTLLILMVIVFFISIIAAVYSFQRGRSGTTGGVTIQPAQPTISVVTTGQGGTFQYQRMGPTPNEVSVPQPYNQYPPPPNSSMQPQYPGQPMFVQAQPYQMQALTNVVYSENPPDHTASGQVQPQY